MAGYIEQFGNQLALNINGDRFLAYPTQGEVWIINGTGDPGPDPDPGPDGPPDPGSGVGFIWPFGLEVVSSEYGPRDGRVHQGIDLAPGGGAAIAASNDGTIRTREYHSGFGNHVIIAHGTMGGPYQLYTLYAHMVNPGTYGPGTTVSKGQTIGHVGNTGNSFGAHLHFETHVSTGDAITWTNPGTHVNPRDFMRNYGES